MKKSFVFFAILGLLSLPLLAQDHGGAADKAEVFGGYQYLHIGNNTDIGLDAQGFNGWDAAGQFNFNKFMGVEGDFSGTYATISGVSTHVYTYAGGPVVFANIGNIKPFAHVLFGGTQLGESQSGASASWNGYTFMFGGGVDARVKGPLAIRLAQVDWLYYHFGAKTIETISFPSFSGSNNVRISTGLVVRF